MNGTYANCHKLVTPICGPMVTLMDHTYSSMS